MERLFPDPAEISIAEQVGTFDPAALATAERPYVFTNFAATVDGRVAIDGKSGAIGSSVDTAMFAALRSRANAIMVGGGTFRTETYGRLIRDAAVRERRELAGMAPDPIAVIVSGRMNLPWEGSMFTSGFGSVVILTTSDAEPPETATPVEVFRDEGEVVDLAGAMRRLRTERGVGALLCEGGPTLHGRLIELDLVDELFLTSGPLIGGGDGPGIFSGSGEGGPRLELVWLLREGSELFARYRVAR